MTTLIIENINKKFVPALRSMVGALGGDIKISKKVQNAEKWRKEIAGALKAYKLG